MKNSRRSFLKKTAIGSFAAMNLGEIVNAAIPETSRLEPEEPKGGVIVFQGDSITDMYRKSDIDEPNDSRALGNGYALIASGEILYRFPQGGFQIYNKGISGNKVFQLAERWQEDCLDLRPTVLSILVGVNDFWHVSKHGYTGTIETYKNDYHNLIMTTRNALPDVKIIIGEPFAVKGVQVVDDSWFPAFDEYRKAAKEIAEETKSIFLPYQSVFDEAIQHASNSYWTIDGVHPSLAGSKLMATAWLRVTGF